MSKKNASASANEEVERREDIEEKGLSFLFSQLAHTTVNLRWKCCEIESKNGP